MKKSIAVAFLFMFIVAISVIVFKRNKPRDLTDEVVPRHATKLYDVASRPLKIHVNFKAETKANISKNEKTLPQIPIWCQAQWDRLISLGSVEFKEGLKSNEYKDVDSCFEFIPNSGGVKNLIQSTCANKNGTLENESLCNSSLFIYRTLLIDLSTSDEKNYDKMSLQILLNKIFGRVVQGEDIWKSSTNYLRAMALAVKNIEPNNPSSYRVLGAVEMILDSNETASQYARQGLDLDPTDGTLRDIWFYTQSVNEKFDLAGYAQSNPNDDLASYYLASQLWKSGNFNGARKIMSNLVKTHPESSRYKDAWLKVSNSSDSSEHAFDIDIPMLTKGW
jgi:tetratricopeptide (TPR) repeat protein